MTKEANLNPNDNFFYGTIFSYSSLFVLWFGMYLRMIYSKSNTDFMYKFALLAFFCICVSFRMWLDLKYKCEPSGLNQGTMLYFKSLASTVYLLFPLGVVQKLTTMDGILAPFANTIGFMAVYSKIQPPLNRLIQSYKNSKSSLTPEENIYFEIMTNKLDILINALTPSSLDNQNSILDKLNLSKRSSEEDIATIKTMTRIRYLIAEAVWFVFSAFLVLTNLKLYLKSYTC